MNNKLIIAIIVILVAVLGLTIAVLVLSVQLSGYYMSQADAPLTIVIDTECGKVRGSRQYTLYDEKPYYAFKGIPYAQPPLGELRFKPPKKVDHWTGIRDSTRFGSVCLQMQEILMGDEDCLFLNVFTPNTDPYTKLPVLVALHGGAYKVGAGQEMGPDFLLNEANVVVVSINYRLGPLGFLSLNSTEYSGNMGLKDQLLALKWIQSNIQYFGGDKYQTTVYGFSAGSSSAHLMILSQAAVGLFQRAIMMSGVAINPFAFTYTVDNQRQRLNTFAEENQHPGLNVDELIDFLIQVDAELLVSQVSIADIFATGSGRKEIDLVWVPVVEPTGTVDPFLLRSPWDIMNNGFQSTVDTMFGVASDESYPFLVPEFRDPGLLARFNEDFEVQLPLGHLNENFDFASMVYQAMSPKIRTNYFPGNTVNEETLYEYSVLVSDIILNYGIDRAAKINGRTSSGKTFYFKFSVNGTFNIPKMGPRIMNDLNFPGATHGDESFYSFRMQLPGISDEFYQMKDFDSIERQTVRIMARLYTNFMIYGNPIPSVGPEEFKPLHQSEINYVEISNDGISSSAHPFEENVRFWDELFVEHELLPINNG